MKFNFDLSTFAGNFYHGYLEKITRETKPLYYPYQVYKYAVFLPLFSLITAFLGLTALLLMNLSNQRVASSMGVIWARFNCLITPMPVEVSGLEKIDRRRSYVIVANHQSQFDIFVLYGWMPVDFKWVMKIEMRKLPVIGYVCDRLGHIYIDRANGEAARASINAAKGRIKAGTSIMFFPEGTRSDTGKMGDFKKGAFRFALEMGLPLLPVTISGTREVLPARSTALFPGRARMIIHDPIETGDYTDGNINDLMLKARRAIQEGLTLSVRR